MAVEVGVWGVGTWGEKHARVYHGLKSAKLVGVYDLDTPRARAVAERYGCRAFASATELLKACQAVSIAVPTVSHREAFEQAAAAGRHALVEKPIAASTSEADLMLRAAGAAGVTLQIGQVERFNPALLAAAPCLGRPKFIEAHRLALFQPRSLDIDVVFDLMIHDLDIVLDRVGMAPTQVSGVGVDVLSSNEDIAHARLEFEDGCVANLTASRVSQERLRRIRFFQDDAYVSVDLLDKSTEVLRVDRAALKLARAASSEPSSTAGLKAIRREALEVGAGEPLTLELEAFVASLADRGPGAASGEAGRAALDVAAHVRAAMKERARRWSFRPSGVS